MNYIYVKYGCVQMREHADDFISINSPVLRLKTFKQRNVHMYQMKG